MMDSEPSKTIRWRLKDDDAALREYLSAGRWRIDASLVKQSKGRSVYLVTPADPALPRLYIKHDHPRRWHDRFKALLRCKARVEFDIGVALARADVPCVPVLAFGRRRTDSWLVTREARGPTFTGRWRRWRGDPIKRRALIAAWRKLLIRMRKAGVMHQDLHPRNVLCVREGRRVRLVLVDLYAVRIGSFDLKQFVMTTIWLMHGFFPGLTGAEVDALRTAAGAPPGRGDAMWREALAYARAKVALMRSKRRKKMMFASQLCACVTTAAGRWLLRRPFTLQVAERAIAEHQRQVREAPGTLLHQDAVRTVSRVAIGRERLVVYRFAPVPRTERVAGRRWLATYRLGGPGVRAARHLAWLSSESGDYLICRDLGRLNLAQVLAAGGARARAAAADAGALFARLHASSISAPLRATQIVHQPRAINPLYTLGIIHALSVRFGSRLSDRERRQDLAALISSFPPGVPAALRCRLLAGYRRAADMTRAQLRTIVGEAPGSNAKL